LFHETFTFVYLGGGVADLEVHLSAVLRQRLAAAHAALERASGLPDRITTLSGYIACLLMYFRLFSTLEDTLDAFQDAAWDRLGVAPVRRAGLLADDLHRLGAFRPLHSRPIWRPETFAQALGVSYVLEGSALGGQVILAALQPKLGDQIAGTTSFFAGQGRDTASYWRRFKTALDDYGAAHPHTHDDVVEGAARCFGVFLDAAMDAASVPA
jgi:heme oxygenase